MTKKPILEMSDDRPFNQTRHEEGLQGQFLIATPSMQDPRFEKSVIYILEHDRKGAMGLVVNKQFDEIAFVDLLEQLAISHLHDVPDYPVHFGGPVEVGRGFVLHSNDVMIEQSVDVGPFAITTSTVMLSKIAEGQGPEKMLFALGYSGWSEGQLDEEFKRNDWISLPACPKTLFETPCCDRWKRVLERSGINLLSLSSQCGSA